MLTADTSPLSWALIHGVAGDMAEELFHQPVMTREVVERLVTRPDVALVDGTVGLGGHSLALLQAAPDGLVLGIDRDPRSLAKAAQRLASFGPRFIPAQGSYAQMVELAAANGIAQVNGVLLDLGFSSWQVDTAGYGLSFQRDEALDMRYDPNLPESASDIVNRYAEEELVRILFQFGEEPRARAITRSILRNRPITTTGKLVDVVTRASGAGARSRSRINPATRTFQALRIAVNDELGNLETGLGAAAQLLAPGGRLAVISYHSLEDRIVKSFLTREAAGCVCPPGFPQCVCGHEPTLRLINRRVIKPTEEETRANPRSRSARMRVAERLSGL